MSLPELPPLPPSDHAWSDGLDLIHEYPLWTAAQMQEYATLSLQEAERRIAELEQLNSVSRAGHNQMFAEAQAANRRAEAAEADARRLREALEELVELASNWSVSGVYFNEACFPENVAALAAARAALAAEHRAALTPGTAQTSEREEG
jgi:hypothetical protein